MPQLGTDIFFGNHFKPKGSVQAYGEAHPPSSMSYNISSGLCFPNTMLNSSTVSDTLRKNASFHRLHDKYVRLELEIQELAAVVNKRSRHSGGRARRRLSRLHDTSNGNMKGGGSIEKNDVRSDVDADTGGGGALALGSEGGSDGNHSVFKCEDGSTYNQEQRDLAVQRLLNDEIRQHVHEDPAEH